MAIAAQHQKPRGRPDRPGRRGRPTAEAATAGVRGPRAASGPLTTSSDRDENRLRELLYNLRIEGIIEFDRPLGRFSAIRRAERAADATASRSATAGSCDSTAS